MKFVITGSRHGHPDVERWMLAFARKHGVPELTIVGDQTGVDAQAYDLVVSHQWSHAIIRVKRALGSPEKFHDRNQRMVDLAGPSDVCLAFPRADSRGTWDCARRAKERGLRVIEARLPPQNRVTTRICQPKR